MSHRLPQQFLGLSLDGPWTMTCPPNIMRRQAPVVRRIISKKKRRSTTAFKLQQGTLTFDVGGH